jgi:hypothetical protein
VVRAVLDLGPEDLRRRHRHLEEEVIAQLGEEASPAADGAV